MSATARLGFVPKKHGALCGGRTSAALADQAPASDTSVPNQASQQAAASDPLKSAVVEARLANAVAQVSCVVTVLQHCLFLLPEALSWEGSAVLSAQQLD